MSEQWSLAQASDKRMRDSSCLTVIRQEERADPWASLSRIPLYSWMTYSVASSVIFGLNNLQKSKYFKTSFPRSKKSSNLVVSELFKLRPYDVHLVVFHYFKKTLSLLKCDYRSPNNTMHFWYCVAL